MVPHEPAFTVADKYYDEEPGDALAIVCLTCGNYDTLVEFTMVPRHMGAGLYRTAEGEIVVSLNNGGR